MTETFRMRVIRLIINVWPAIRRTGGRVTYIANGWHELHVKLPLNWRTYNAVGTIFGGSMYASCDPFYMLMLMSQLGPDYIVWDRAASIRFRRPGTTTLKARFCLDPQEVEAIRSELSEKPSVTRTFEVDLVDEYGKTCANIEKQIYIRRGDRLQQGSGGLGARFINWMLRPEQP